MGEPAPMNPGQEDEEDRLREREILAQFIRHSKKYQSALSGNRAAREDFDKYDKQLHNLSGILRNATLRMTVDGEKFVLVPRKINFRDYADLSGSDSDRPEVDQDSETVMAVAENQALNNTSIAVDQYMLNHVPDEWAEKIATALSGNEEEVRGLVNAIPDAPTELDG